MGVGKLRHRNGELVVEGMSGEILAKVEPDPEMRVDVVVVRPFFDGGPGTTFVEISWKQSCDDHPDYIDVDAVEEELPQLP